MDAKEQTAEINRIREAIAVALQAITPIHPREASLALLAMAIQLHKQGSTMSDIEIKEQLEGMLSYLITNTVVVQKKEIN